MSLEHLYHLFFSRLHSASFEVRYWNGRSVTYGPGSPEFVICLRDRSVCQRVLANPSIGFGEGYASGAIEVEGSLKTFLKMMVVTDFSGLDLTMFEKARMLLMRYRQRDTLSQAKRNIAHHYDVGNDFYELWLGQTMAYSCAYFKGSNDGLDVAQNQKFELLCKKLHLASDQSLLDIGCGWGGLLFYAARNYKVACTGITISEKQFTYATRRAVELGLENQVTFLLQDYRDLSRAGREFDRIVSVGMVEHVGKEFLSQYAACTADLLKEQGVGVIQSIGRQTSAPISPWIAKHIFPGMYLPTLDVLVCAWRNCGLFVTDVEALRLHYALTLSRWSDGVQENRAQIEARYGTTFYRSWLLYLCICETAMLYGDLTLWQIQYYKGVNNSHPLTRDYIYSHSSQEPNVEPS